MSAIQRLNIHQWADAPPPKLQATFTLPVGASSSLRDNRRTMRLKVLRGKAWVTLDDGPFGTLDDSGDVLVCAGQSFEVPAGQYLVLEPLGAEVVKFQWLVR